MKPKAKLVNISDIKGVLGMNGKMGTIVAFFATKVLGFNKINSDYSKISHYENEEFTKNVVITHNINCDINPSEIDTIPKEGSFITISNHPYGVIDGMMIFATVRTIRKDYKAIVNFVLAHLENVKDCIFSVNPFSDHKELKSSFSGIKMAMEHLSNGGALGLFPAGEVSTYHKNKKYTEDADWQKSIIKLIRNSNVPVIPIYFSGTNSKIFHFLGKIHPLLRTMRLPRELTGTYGKTVAMRIGKPISPSEIAEYPDLKALSNYLRARTYALEANVKSFSEKSLPKETPIIPPIDKDKLIKEFESLYNSGDLLFQTANYHCYLSDYKDIPNIIQEIGRKREESFRGVGEGTNNAIDLDKYDEYYKHLILWDDQEKRIVGAYRLGIGEEIMKEYGVEGFYSNTLFKYSKEVHHILSNSIELGRSFLSIEYKKETIPLLLLIKGLLYSVLKYPDSKYFIGPVSISSWYPRFYQSLMINYLERTQDVGFFSKNIIPRTPFRPDFLRVDVDSLISNKVSSVEKFDRFLLRLSNNEYRLPTLLKKYLKFNSKIISYNVDKDFNYCVDCLVLLELTDLPKDEILTLAKGVEDIEPVLRRFGYGTGS